MRKIVIGVLLLLFVTGCVVNQTNSNMSDKKVKYIVEIEFPVGTVREYRAVDYFTPSDLIYRITLEDGTQLTVSKHRAIIHSVENN